MVLVAVEKTFPRGGLQGPVESNATRGPRRGKTSIPRLFGSNAVSKEHKEIPQKNKDGKKNKGDKSSVFRMKGYTGQLMYKTVTEGILVLGSINKIEEYQLTVSLPNNVTGIVPISNISDSYTAALRNVLQDVKTENVYPLEVMFKVGQHVIARVLTKVFENNRHKITLSLDPECIYSDVSHSDVRKGSVMVAAVKSIQENIYVMELGIKSTRAFLAKDDAHTFQNLWNNAKPLGIGQLVRCYVTKSTTIDSCTTLKLSADPSKVAKANNNSTGATLETLIPGMQFSVIISRIFSTGIQVRLSDNFVGYVHQDHFSKPFKTPENFEIGSVTTAKVLYILETGAVYFTMKSGIFEATPVSSPYEAMKIGTIVEAADVISITQAGISLRIGKSGNEALKGLIPLRHTRPEAQTTNDEFEMTLAQQLTTEYPIGSRVRCRILKYNYIDQYFFCTMDESLMMEKIIHPDMLEVGLVVPCYIKSVVLKGIVLRLGKKSSVTGFVPLIQVSDVPLSHPEKKFHVGQPCMARVLSVKNGKIFLTMKVSLVKSKTEILHSFEAAEVGNKHAGTVIQVTPKGLLVQFYNFVSGWIPPDLLSSEDTIQGQDVAKNFYVGQPVICSIAKKDEIKRQLVLSLRDIEPSTQLNVEQDSGIDDEDETNIPVPVFETVCDKANKLKKTKIVEGVQTANGNSSSEPTGKKKKERKKKNKDGIPVEIKPEEDTNEVNVVGETSKGKVTKKAKAKKVHNVSKMEIESLDSDIEVDDAHEIIEKLNKKKKKLPVPDGEVESNRSVAKGSNKKRKKDDSLLVENDERKKRKVTDETKEGKLPVPDAEVELNRSGAKDSNKKRKKDSLLVENNETKKGKVTDKTKNKKIPVPSKLNGSVAKDTDKKLNKDDSLLAKSAKRKKRNVTDESDVGKEAVVLPRLSVSTGFVWDATPDLLPVVADIKDDSDSSDEDDSTVTNVKRSRKAILAEKRRLAQEEEIRVRMMEQRLMAVDQPPQSADEFDRLVLSSPNSSMVWLQFMAHHLQATEIEKARNVAQRALKTISFREEEEKLNVWVALLNLENLYGTKKSLESVLEEAVKVNDAYQVYTKMLQIYGDSHKLQEGNNLVTVMTKKFKSLKDMWFNAAMFYMKSGQIEKARGLLQRALTNIEKKEHVSVISRFAQMENKMGSMERAQTLFEQILTTYPKRVDVWSAYVDMLVKSNLIALARQVLERAIVQKLKSHKMKTLFKKFLTFEEEHGNKATANKVRQLALEYVESAEGADLQ